MQLYETHAPNKRNKQLYPLSDPQPQGQPSNWSSSYDVDDDILRAYNHGKSCCSKNTERTGTDMGSHGPGWIFFTFHNKIYIWCKKKYVTIFTYKQQKTFTLYLLSNQYS